MRSRLLYFSRSIFFLSGGAREHRDNVSVLPICLNKEIMDRRSLTGGDDKSKIHESAEEIFIVFEAVQDVFGGDAALKGGATLVFFKPGFNVCAFILFEPSNNDCN